MVSWDSALPRATSQWSKRRPEVSPRPASNPLCAFDLELDRVPKWSGWMQISVVSLLLFPGDSKRQAQAAVCWGLDWRQVDLLGKRPLFTGGKKKPWVA